MSDRRIHFTLVALVVALPGAASIASAQSAGTFTGTGNMTSARWGHTATLLAGGRVLIAGGCADPYGVPPFCRQTIIATAEIYDPATGSFAATGNMTSPRLSHTATLLPDSTLLIAAGYAGTRSEDSLASAELYDPSTGTFAATGSMTTPSHDDKNTATFFSDAGIPTIVAGNPTSDFRGDGGPGTLSAPVGIARDAAGNPYIADTIPGLDQVNVPVPASPKGVGKVPVVLSADTTNSVSAEAVIRRRK